LRDLDGQYCYRNCIGCSAFSVATAGLSCYFFTKRTVDFFVFKFFIVNKRLTVNAKTAIKVLQKKKILLWILFDV